MTIVSLFSGALGLDIGLEHGITAQALQAGLGQLGAMPRVQVAVESDAATRETIRLNKGPDLAVFNDVTRLQAAEVIGATGTRAGEFFLVSGGPPCQPFSTAGKREAFGDPRGSLFMEYVRLVGGLQPRFFVMENVRGLLSAALQHRPIAQRGASFPPLNPAEIQGSAFEIILEQLGGLGYSLTSGLLNAADYGVPQKRQRLIVLGSRDHENIALPMPTHSEGGVGGLEPWQTVQQAWQGLEDATPESPPYPPSRAQYLALVPPGSNWRSLPPELREAAMGGAYHSGGGKVGFYRRLAWDQPSPTVTTSPAQKATDMCHPTELRPISVREAARLQQFPDDWVFGGKMMDRYRQIGNAVPIGLGAAIGRSLMQTVQGLAHDGLADTAPREVQMRLLR